MTPLMFKVSAAVRALTERGRHGRQGDPGCAEAKSLPMVRPETPSRSVSLDPRDGYSLDDPKRLAFEGKW